MKETRPSGLNAFGPRPGLEVSRPPDDSKEQLTKLARGLQSLDLTGIRLTTGRQRTCLECFGRYLPYPGLHRDPNASCLDITADTEADIGLSVESQPACTVMAKDQQRPCRYSHPLLTENSRATIETAPGTPARSLSLPRIAIMSTSSGGRPLRLAGRSDRGSGDL